MSNRLSKADQEMQDKAIEQLREIFPPGSTAYTILRHVSRSGMMRHISVIGPNTEDVTFWVARAMNEKQDPRNGGIKVSGCGMDMGFHLVYGMSHTLYPSGYPCSGSRDTCRSAEHRQGRRHGDAPVPYSPDETHTDGGYAVSQRWL